MQRGWRPEKPGIQHIPTYIIRISQGGYRAPFILIIIILVIGRAVIY